MTQIVDSTNSAALWDGAGCPPATRFRPALPRSTRPSTYCAHLARTHYENFSVATWFLPKRLRQHFFNVYAYCRISDDLGDEVGDTAASLALLDQWQRELDACYEGAPKHPVFVALAETVRQFDIPKHEFSDLLTAFRQDQTVTRFETFNDVLGILPLLCQSGWASRAVSVRISRCGTAAAFRLHLHGAATRQFLAGRQRGLRKGPHLSSARRPATFRSHRRRDRAATKHAGILRDDEIPSGARP